MKNSYLYQWLPLTFILSALALSAISCNKRKYTTPNPDTIFGNWEMTRSSDAYIPADSLWYLRNPSAPQQDSIFYNGMYSDQYVHNDSLRAILIYDSVAGYRLYVQRMIGIVVNPLHLTLQTTDTAICNHRMDLLLSDSSQNLYSITPRATMDSILMQERETLFKATTSLATDVAGNAQTYIFRINSAGFAKARAHLSAINHSLEGHIHQKP